MSGNVKSIITVQHTQSVHHTNGMVGSWTDWELTELGKKQAENIGRKLSAEIAGQNYKIYSSDLKRARQTAEPIARYMNAEIEFLEKLREINYGDAVGKSKQWMKENSRPVNSFNDRSFPGAESWREFWIRVNELFNDIMADMTHNIVLVTHGGICAVWLQIWLGAGIQEGKFGPAGSVSFMEMSVRGDRKVKLANDLSYMQD